MNPAEQFVPKWAELALSSKEHKDAEIGLHRDFFDAWEHLHSLPNNHQHRRRAEEAAQKLVEIAEAIKRLRDVPIVGRYS